MLRSSAVMGEAVFQRSSDGREEVVARGAGPASCRLPMSEHRPPGGGRKRYHMLCRWRLRLSTERTSLVKRNASSTGSRLSSAMSRGSENHDLMGMALSASREGGTTRTTTGHSAGDVTYQRGACTATPPHAGCKELPSLLGHRWRKKQRQ